MKKPLIVLLLTSQMVFGLGQQVTLLQNQPIVIEYYHNLPDGKALFLTVLETQTKKKASVELTPSLQDKKILVGGFKIQLDMNKLPSQNLEFLTKSGDKLFAHVIPNANSKDNTLSVALFNKESEWQAYTANFLNKANEELLKQQKKIQQEAQKNLKNVNFNNSPALEKLKEKNETLDSRIETCDHWGSEFNIAAGSRRRKFCSESCWKSHRKATPKNCPNCNCLFTPVKAVASGKFISYNSGKTCSAYCNNQWIRNNPERKRKIGDAFRGANHPNRQGGKSLLNNVSNRGPNWKKQREAALRRDKYQCVDCCI